MTSDSTTQRRLLHYRLISGWACIGFSTLSNIAARAGNERTGPHHLQALYDLFDATRPKLAECQLLHGENLLYRGVFESKRVCHCSMGYMASEGVDAFCYCRV